MGLKSKAVNGFLWSSAGTLGNGLVSLGVTVILARLLTPADFALIALLTIFVSVSNVIIDSGFSQAIIRDDKASQEDMSSVFYFNIVIAVAFYVILFFAAPAISAFYDAPTLTIYSRVVFLVIVFNSLTLIQNATLRRSLNFATVEKAAVVGSFLAGITSVAMAFAGLGIWSLVANMVLMPFFRSVMLWKMSDWRPTFQFNFGSIRKYLKFSAFLSLHQLIDVIVTNLNALFIGKVYAKNDLGYYSQSEKLDNYIVTPMTTVIAKVIFPITTKVRKDSGKLSEAYGLISGVISFVAVPIMLFVSFNADSTIIFFFGEKWQPAGQYLQIIALLALVQVIQSVFTNVMLVAGKTHILMTITVIRQCLRVITLLFTIRISVYSMVLGFVLAGILGSMLYIIAGMRILHYTVVDFIKNNAVTLLTAGISVSTTYVTAQINCDSSILFVIQIVVLGVTYIGMNIILKNRYWGQIVSLIKSLNNSH